MRIGKLTLSMTSLITKVILGFSLIFILMVMSMLITLSNQKEQGSQVDVLTSHKVPILNKVNQLLETTQNVNKIVSQHAANHDQTILSELEAEFVSSIDLYVRLYNDVKILVQESSQLTGLLQSANEFAQATISDASLHLKQRARLLELSNQYQNEYHQQARLWRDYNDDLRIVDRVVENLNNGDLAIYNPSAGGKVKYLLDKLTVLRDNITGLNNITESKQLQNLTESLSSDINMGTQWLEELESDSAIIHERITPYWNSILKTYTHQQGAIALYRDLLALEEKNRTLFFEMSDSLNQSLDLQRSLAARITAQVEIISHDVYQANSDSMKLILVMLGVSALLSIAIVISLVSSIRKPMVKIVGVLQELSKGHLDHYIDIESRDEFGMISKNVNSVTQQLNTLISGVVDSSDHLNQLATHNQEISDRSDQVFERQLNEIDSVASAITQMESSFQGVYANTEHARDNVLQLNQVVNQGQQQISNNIETADKLAAQISSSLNVSARLDETANDIGQILQVISGIAAKTNLLALNAAIEAARAGEHGRGFAVVADEVRSLASGTSESVDQIESLIQRLQDDTVQVSQVLHSNVEKINDNVAQVTQVGDAMKQIHAQLERINIESDQIRTATEEQVTTAGDVSRRIQEIANVSREGKQNLEQLLDLGERLSKLAHAQEHSIRQFHCRVDQ
jgi:methyl-accepting chemotaxis protein